MPLGPGEGKQECRAQKGDGCRDGRQGEAQSGPGGWESSSEGSRHVYSMAAGGAPPEQQPVDQEQSSGGCFTPRPYEAGPASGIIQVSVWKEEVSRAALLLTGQAQN